MSNFLSQSCPPESLFNVEQIPDLTGQVMIVTGGNTGIGKETCNALLNKGARVYLAARSKSKADAAIEWLKTETHGKAPIFLELDLANLVSVRKAAEDFKSKEQELHVLFNNAGVMTPPVNQRTADGYDLQFGTNVLGHYFFTILLLPTLVHTAKTSPLTRGHVRVINTSSGMLYSAPRGGIIWETLGTDPLSVKAAESLGATKLYAQSKLGNVLFSNELAKRYVDQGIILSSLHPGSIQTDLHRNMPWLVTKLISPLVYPASYGALTQLWSGTMPEGENHNGKFLIPWARVGDAGPYSHDEKLAERLWTWLEEQSFPPKSLFTVEQIPDLTGQVMIVTGGNTGIGMETCKALLNKNAKVYLAARSKSRADVAIEWLRHETNGKAPVFLELDLANLTSVRKAVEEFKGKEHQLHVLFNNAGVMAPPVDQRTADGYDLQFGTNVLGHYFFTSLLLPTLIHTAKTSPVAHGHARVVNTSSGMLHSAPKGGIVWETLGTDISSVKAAKKLGATRLYAQSKLGNVLFSNELAKRCGDQGIISSSLHPGSIQTDLLRHWPWLIAKILELTLYPASYGALTQLWSGTMPEGENHNGKYLIPWARVGDAGPYSHDEKLAERLWAWLEEQVKGH